MKTVKFHRIYVHAGADGVIRNVGVTHKDARARLAEHLKEARQGIKNHRCNWLRSLDAPPSVEVIEWVRPEDRAEREKYWIALFRDYGHRLVNGTDGGDGAAGRVVTSNTRAKISRTLSGRKNSPAGPMPEERKEAISATLTGHKKEKVSSRYRGVCWHQRDKKWMAKIRRFRRNIYLGYFDTELEAAKAVDGYAIENGLNKKLLNFSHE